MNWQQAFLYQARSDYAVLQRLNTPAVEYAHRLHYFQMVTEKLAKSMLCGPLGTTQPKTTHAAFVKMLQTLKSQPQTWLWQALGFKSKADFAFYIEKCLDMARKIERLAPDGRGAVPNPEYPWRDPGSGAVIPPALHKFREFDPLNPEMSRVETIIRNLIRLLADA